MTNVGCWAAGLAMLLGMAGHHAAAQSIASQPLPPPAATAPATASAKTTKPTAHVPVLTAPSPATKKAAVAKSTAKLATKPAAKPAAKPLAATPAKPLKTPAPAGPAPLPPAAPPRADPTKGASTGLTLPRWASFRSDEVNLRSGPGMQYPIDWVYHRRDLPVQIQREFEIWRLVQDQDGTKGWVHQATLTGRRGFVVQGGEQVLRAAAADTADPVARLKPGVVGHVRSCAAGADWCEVQAGDYRGWLKRTAMYGVSPNEAIE